MISHLHIIIDRLIYLSSFVHDLSIVSTRHVGGRLHSEVVHFLCLLLEKHCFKNHSKDIRCNTEIYRNMNYHKASDLLGIWIWITSYSELCTQGICTVQRSISIKKHHISRRFKEYEPIVRIVCLYMFVMFIGDHNGIGQNLRSLRFFFMEWIHAGQVE